MNGFVNMFLSGECWYLFNEMQPQYLSGNSFKLPCILEVIKKSNLYIGYFKYTRITPI